MPQASRPKSAVIPFSRHVTEPEEEPLPPLPMAPTAAVLRLPPKPDVTAVDLSGKPKLIFLIGPNLTGKTMLARWLSVKIDELGGSMIAAACDPDNRSLALYLDHVWQPRSSDPDMTALELRRELLEEVLEQKVSALIDLGGGNSSLDRLLATEPEFADTLEAHGIPVVAIYLFSSRWENLVTLKKFEDAGFRPVATALVRNERYVEPQMTREQAFSRLMRDDAWKSAIGRGAVPLWLPKLPAEVAEAIEAKRLTFSQARDGKSPEGRKVIPLGPFAQSSVRRWLAAMDIEFGPIMSWLPGAAIP